MKKIFTLCVLMCFVIFSRSQAVLNEVYPQPGNGYHEFFELYNETNAVESLDNYTLVSYYEEGTKSGFFVFDLPSVSINAHGYYVAASANPFDIQSQLGLTANTNWNALTSGGAITKWERNGSSYSSVAVPSNLNDLFVKIVGSGGVFHILLYKNGILINGLIAGFSSNILPAYFKSMPNLPIDMLGSSPDFTINFNAIPDNALEYLSNSAGTNNGYFRSSDGLCGDWLKSDSPGQHTPGQTNGTSANLASQVGIAASVTQYAGDPTKALLTYNITAGPAGAFPVIVDVYIDNGIAGQLDLADVLLDTRTITSISAGAQNVVLPSWDTQVIIVLRSASDCYNRNIVVGNYWSVLPINLISFQGNMNKSNKVVLQWKVADNETANIFEVQRSTDGIDFKTIGLVFTSEKTGVEDYMFYETIDADKAMYRLKMIDKQQNVSFSKILVFGTKIIASNSLKIIGNPVNDKLTFSYTATTARTTDVKIYDMSGRIILNNKLNNDEGYNMISINLDSACKAGMYVVELNNGVERLISKFIKQ